LTRYNKKITFLAAALNAMYSTSVVDSAMVVCSFEIQIIGQLANLTTYPVQERQSLGFIGFCFL
jgi:hypothetical protein